MKSDEWEKIKLLLDEALTLGGSERKDFLSKTATNPAIRAEVESLLAVESAADDFMSVTASRFAKEIVLNKADSAQNFEKEKIGIYQITGELGFGGMGAVFLAERADGKFQQKVAIKMLRREFNSAQIRQRFEREKNIQSKLVHPNIARLLDSGTTAEGIPFLVMEYIEGVPIDRFCDEKNLDVNARLRLFNKVCDAVAFAHRNLIVHRDLKASNILVTNDGAPKLLDFGISKLLDETIENTPTLVGAMTPQYASPEQIKGETVTTATDIYSLGVVLYKILTGAFPYDFDGKINGDIYKIVSENEPPKPSERQNSKLKNHYSSSEISNIKKQKSKFLKGDLDNITLKALSKEPARRYETIEQFSADVSRFLENLPVSARPATFVYRLSKFYGRNKIAVIAAALVFLSLISGIAVAVREAKIANQQAQIALESRNIAQNEAAKARSEQEKAEKISRFMFKVVSYANPGWYAEGARFGGNARVLDVLEDLSDQIDVEFQGNPDVQAELHHKFTEVFTILGSSRGNAAEFQKYTEKRRFHALRALELRKQFYGEHHELVAKDLFYSYALIANTDAERAAILANAIQMMRETNQNNLNYPYMLEAYISALILPDEYEKYHEPYRRAVIPATNENNFQIAERYLREALAFFRMHYKENNLAIAANECKLAYTLAMQEKWNDFDEHHTICRQSNETLKDMRGKKLADLEAFAKLVERTLTEKFRR